MPTIDSLPVFFHGSGTPVLLIHGSATDHTTWTVQQACLKEDFFMLSYDRCNRTDVESHAKDAAEVLRSEVQGPCFVVGSSFGAVIALELTRRFPTLVRSLLLCEPPLSSNDFTPSVPQAFVCEFDRLVVEEGGPSAAEFFLRSVLGDASFERIPKAFHHRSMSRWSSIRSDIVALSKYNVRYADLVSEITCPVHLCLGECSTSFYEEALVSLQQAIPGASMHTLKGAGHMMQVDAHRQFNRLLLDMKDEFGIPGKILGEHLV